MIRILNFWKILWKSQKTNLQSDIKRNFQFLALKKIVKYCFVSSWSKRMNMIYGSSFTIVVWDSSLNYYSKLNFTMHLYNFQNFGSLLVFRALKSLTIIIFGIWYFCEFTLPKSPDPKIGPQNLYSFVIGNAESNWLLVFITY